MNLAELNFYFTRNNFDNWILLLDYVDSHANHMKVKQTEIDLWQSVY